MYSSRLLTVMRHATARAAVSGERDFDRPLTVEGEAEARGMGRWLARQVPGEIRIMSSPALRARMTAERVAAARTDRLSTVEWNAALYLAELDTLLALLEGEQASLMLIGHNPGLEALLGWLLPDPGRGQSPAPALAPAAVCVLDLPRGAGRGAAVLVAHLRPELLPAAQD